MKFEENNPPREFTVGFGKELVMKDCAHIELEPNEQVTFLTESGAEYDLARKDWGFYATPSLNGRLQQFGLQAAMVKNRIGRYFILLVEKGKEPLFEEYLEIEGLEIVCWMDTTENLEKLETHF